MEEEAVEAEGGEGGGDEGEGDAELKREDTVLRHRKSTRREKAVEGREEGRMRVVEKFGCRWRQARLANEEGLRIELGETRWKQETRQRGADLPAQYSLHDAYEDHEAMEASLLRAQVPRQRSQPQHLRVAPRWGR